jgi:hypothetical protein
LGREQTEEWKGWMQYMFIFYHYYRAYAVYNEIRVFVSAYVWMVRRYNAHRKSVWKVGRWGEGDTREEGVWVVYIYSCLDFFFPKPPQS